MCNVEVKTECVYYFSRIENRFSGESNYCFKKNKPVGTIIFRFQWFGPYRSVGKRPCLMRAFRGDSVLGKRLELKIYYFARTRPSEYEHNFPDEKRINVIFEYNIRGVWKDLSERKKKTHASLRYRTFYLKIKPLLISRRRTEVLHLRPSRAVIIN